MNLETIKHLIETDNLIKFYQCKAWRELRKVVIRNANHECEHCKEKGKLTTANTINRNGKKTKMEVNHKKPLRTHPHLALVLENLEYLCIDCHNIADGKDRYLQQNKRRFFSPERW